MNKFDLNLRINDLSFEGDQSKLMDLIGPMIDELAEKMGILPDAIKASVNNIHTLGENKKAKKEKINLVNIENVTIYSKKHLQCMPKDYINWTSLSRDFILGESVIRKFYDKIDWHWIVARMDEGQYNFSKHFMEEFIEVIAKTRIDIKKNPNIYNDTLVLNPSKPNKDTNTKFPLQGKFLNNNIPGAHHPDLNNDNIHPNPSLFSPYGNIPNIPGMNIGIGGYNDMVYPSDQDYNDLQEEYNDIKNTIITPDNFSDLFDTIVPKLSKDMINDLCRNYKLSKEFIFKYENYLNFRSLMTNDYFKVLMNDGEFFDMYINTFIKLRRISHKHEGVLDGFVIKKPRLND